MRVVLTCDWFLKYTSAQAAALSRAGAEVTILCREHALEFASDRDERERTLAEPREAGVIVHEIPGRYWDTQALAPLRHLRRALRRFAPEVVHAQSPGADPRALALLPRVPTVLTIHDPVLHPGQPVASLALRRWFLEAAAQAWRRRADAIMVHSEHLRADVALRRGQRCAVIPHGLVAVAAPSPPPVEPAVGFFGRLEPYKGLEVIAAAMPQVWRERPAVRVLVAGAGETPLELDDDRVQLRRGYLPEAEITPFFARVSLALLPYTQATQTGAGSQAVGHGVPVIVSRVGGLPDLALDGSYVVEPGEPSSLARAILAHI